VNYKRLACYEHCPGTFGYTYVLYGRKEEDRKSEKSFGKPDRLASSLKNVHNNGNVYEGR